MKKEDYHIRCLVCGRVLKNGESQKRGMGKICFNKITKNKNVQTLFDIQQLKK